jgi:hypothetical protein
VIRRGVARLARFGRLGRLGLDGAHPARDGSPGEVAARRFSTSLAASRLTAHGLWFAWALAGLGLGLLAGRMGWPVMLALALAVSVTAGVMASVLDRNRWRASDVLRWQQVGRLAAWRRDTGGDNPADAAAAEVWLGAHQAGAVPPVYRAIAAYMADDEVTWDRELRAMPDATDEDRACRAWVVAQRDLYRSGAADTALVEALVAELHGGELKATLEAWLPLAQALTMHTRGDRGWLEPLLAAWPAARRLPAPMRMVVRQWLGRLGAVVLLVLVALPVGVASAGIPGLVDPPYAFGGTSLATRGAAPAYDADRVSAALPDLAAAAADATAASAPVVSAAELDSLLWQGMPTLYWETGAIDLAPPPDVPGAHVWSVEVLLGGDPARADVLITLDREDGPTRLYRIDAAVVRELRAAVGLGDG